MQTISVDQNAISASGEQLATVHQRCVKVVVSAAWTNTGVVSISCDSGVTYPIQLGAGQAIPLDVDDVRASLKSLVSRSAGIVRDGETMTQALQMLDFWQNYVYAEEFQSVRGFELLNMLACAQLVIRGALRREESRGAHQRSDFPETDDGRWKTHMAFNRRGFE